MDFDADNLLGEIEDYLENNADPVPTGGAIAIDNSNATSQNNFPISQSERHPGMMTAATKAALGEHLRSNMSGEKRKLDDSGMGYFSDSSSMPKSQKLDADDELSSLFATTTGNSGNMGEENNPLSPSRPTKSQGNILAQALMDKRGIRNNQSAMNNSMDNMVGSGPWNGNRPMTVSNAEDMKVMKKINDILRNPSFDGETRSMHLSRLMKEHPTVSRLLLQLKQKKMQMTANLQDNSSTFKNDLRSFNGPNVASNGFSNNGAMMNNNNFNGDANWQHPTPQQPQQMPGRVNRTMNPSAARMANSGSNFNSPFQTSNPQIQSMDGNSYNGMEANSWPNDQSNFGPRMQHVTSPNYSMGGRMMPNNVRMRNNTMVAGHPMMMSGNGNMTYGMGQQEEVMMGGGQMMHGTRMGLMNEFSPRGMFPNNGMRPQGFGYENMNGGRMFGNNMDGMHSKTRMGNPRMMNSFGRQTNMSMTSPNTGYYVQHQQQPIQPDMQNQQQYPQGVCDDGISRANANANDYGGNKIGGSGDKTMMSTNTKMIQPSPLSQEQISLQTQQQYFNEFDEELERVARQNNSNLNRSRNGANGDQVQPVNWKFTSEGQNCRHQIRSKLQEAIPNTNPALSSEALKIEEEVYNSSETQDAYTLKIAEWLAGVFQRLHASSSDNFNQSETHESLSATANSSSNQAPTKSFQDTYSVMDPQAESEENVCSTASSLVASVSSPLTTTSNTSSKLSLSEQNPILANQISQSIQISSSNEPVLSVLSEACSSADSVVSSYSPTPSLSSPNCATTTVSSSNLHNVSKVSSIDSTGSSFTNPNNFSMPNSFDETRSPMSSSLQKSNRRPSGKNQVNHPCSVDSGIESSPKSNNSTSIQGTSPIIHVNSDSSPGSK